jgi:hypothetical protein
MVHRVTKATASRWASAPRPERCGNEITPLALRVRLTRHPRPRWSSTGPMRLLRELEIAQRFANKEGSSFHRGECMRRKTRLVNMAVARANRPVQRTQPAWKSMYAVQKRTPILEVVLETGTMIVRMMNTAARTMVKRVVMMAHLTSGPSY